MFFLLKHRFGAKELTLPVNYRSNASILEAANRFLQFGSGSSFAPNRCLSRKNIFSTVPLQL